jgi:excisionase family DNA binding protein
MPIRDLGAHPSSFVTVAELAAYWSVSRQQIYKRIGSGALEAIRLGSRLYRVRTRAAVEFERGACIRSARADTSPKPSQVPTSSTAVPWEEPRRVMASLRRLSTGRADSRDVSPRTSRR